MKNFGDVETHQLIRYMENENLPVFYLSDDNASSQKALSLRDDLDVHKLSTLAFLGALSHENILSDMGFAPQSDDALASHIVEYSNTLGRVAFLLMPKEKQKTESEIVFQETMKGIGLKKSKEWKVDLPEYNQPSGRMFTLGLHPSLG